jgi:murein tripeptide amidase MpaA
MKKTVFLLIIVALFTFLASAKDWQRPTVAEESNFTKTSLYSEVMDFIQDAEKRSPGIHVVELAKSSEGRMIPLVVVSKEGVRTPRQMALHRKHSVLILANIHAGEIEGKEACLMLLRDVVNKKLDHILDKHVLLLVPIFNADGNDKLGKNRGDNGPELAGTRANGQNLDLNRDYLKLESPEVNGLVRLFNRWDPVLFVDMHTTNGSYHREPVTYTTLINPNSHQKLHDYMWNNLFPAVQTSLKKDYGYDSIPYGNFKDRANPEKGWRNHAFAALYGNNYAGLRNRFTILDENYSHADFKTRVLSSYGFIHSILKYTGLHIEEMTRMVQEADLETMDSFHKGEFVIDFEVDKLFDFVIKSYQFKKERVKEEDRHKYPPWIKEFIVKKTKKLKDYKVDYYSKPIAKTTTALPNAYIILPAFKNAADNLERHGIVVDIIKNEYAAEVEKFILSEVSVSKRLFQGHAMVTVKGQYKTETITIPKGAYLVSMKQPLARLIPELLEPMAPYGLLKWGFFNRVLVRQWSNRPDLYPVVRVKK